MLIVIDMQGLQASNQFRGIGRYTLDLTRSMVKNKGHHEIILALNDAFPDSVKAIRAAFSDILPKKNIYTWQSGCSNNENAVLIREAALASLKPDIILLTSLFEGFYDQAAISIHKLNAIPTAVIFYDLIPVFYPEIYFQDPLFFNWYQNRLDDLRKADLLLSISESARQEAIQQLGISDEKVVNILGAVNSRFKKILVSDQDKDSFHKKYQLPQNFILYTGGIEYRKNVESLIRAYVKLPLSLRNSYQLVIVCSIEPAHKIELEKQIKAQGLEKKQIVFTGFVSDEDLLLFYNLCDFFIFPSLHEGFGLPILEAMCCGKAVIAANSPGVSEILGREDALFDPRDDHSITSKMLEVLEKPKFKEELIQHGLKRISFFSWDISAKKAIAAFENLQIKQESFITTEPSLRLKLAYVSPLPPEKCGISEYSAQLLPALMQYYDIDVIVDQKKISCDWVQKNCQCKSIKWFKENFKNYDRIIYQMGNSISHQHMFELLEKIPGIVVLHDFFMSDVLMHMQDQLYQKEVFLKALYHSHGYIALYEFFSNPLNKAPQKYPGNLSVIQSALGVIVHSKHSLQLAENFYSKKLSKNWFCIPLVRVPAKPFARKKARDYLKLKEDTFLVCSFGFITETKLSHRLIEAWLSSDLIKNPNCLLVFVGENAKNDYGDSISSKIIQSGFQDRILITDWLDKDNYQHYLMAADFSVQLRTLSRGETSGTVLDGMNYGLPTIVNAHGSMADFSSEVVLRLEDDFTESELITALNTLYLDEDLRHKIGKKVSLKISLEHAPEVCANDYHQIIEKSYASIDNTQGLINALSDIESNLHLEDEELMILSESIATSIPALGSLQLLIDVSALLPQQTNMTKESKEIWLILLKTWMTSTIKGYRVEPVYLTKEKTYCYARNFSKDLLNFPTAIFHDDKIEFQQGDLFLILDILPDIISTQQNFYEKMSRYGVSIQFLARDFLITKSNEMNLLKMIAKSDGLISITSSKNNPLLDQFNEMIFKNSLCKTHSFYLDIKEVEWESFSNQLMTVILNQSNSMSCFNHPAFS